MVSGMKEFLSIGNREAPGSVQIIHPLDVLILRQIKCTSFTVHIQRSARLLQDEFTGSNQCGNGRRVHRRGIHRRVLMLVHSRGQRSPGSACRSRVDDGQRLGHAGLHGKRNPAVARAAGAGILSPAKHSLLRAVGAHGLSAVELRQRACGSFGFQVPAFGGAVKRFGEQPPIFDFVTVQKSSNMFNCDSMIALRNDYN
jgi:hypothetical protein